MMRGRRLWGLLIFLVANTFVNVVVGEVRTWDGRHSIEKIDVRVVYFVPKDRQPLADWKRRADYFCRRIEQFHELEYDGQSVLKTTVEAEPFVSKMSTQQLREGDGDAIFFRTLREVDAGLDWNESDSEAFPIVLVLSEINWRPLDDFNRLRQTENGIEFEGQFIDSQHFPGATSGGARATYLSREGKGWGLVSADGWRVPYRGTDCVVYHEGVGHTIGLPHPESGNGSVMSLGQYRGWISESWIDKDQKLRLGWQPHSDTEMKNEDNLFRQFRAIPNPLVPKPGDEVSLNLDLPPDVTVQSCIAEVQTDVHGPWLESTSSFRNASRTDLSSISLGRFDRHTPVSYRVKVTLEDGRSEELWGYFQVGTPQEIASVMPRSVLFDERSNSTGEKSSFSAAAESDQLEALNVSEAWKNGDWTREDDNQIVSPKKYGAKIELPGKVSGPYRLIAVVEPLDPPNGLILGSRIGESRFVTLLNFAQDGRTLSALENVDGKNVGNFTTVDRPLFEVGKLSQVVLTVEDDSVSVVVDGTLVVEWSGQSTDLSLSDYWRTPDENALFLGTYDCRYRFHRLTLQTSK